jgi:hypothetical protein
MIANHSLAALLIDIEILRHSFDFALRLGCERLRMTLD